MKPIIWNNCYDQGWRGMIVPEAFAHPAKFSRALIARILSHGLEVGWWRPGDVLGDPFGGVALGGLMAANCGLSWIGVELEKDFVILGNRNLHHNSINWCTCGYDGQSYLRRVRKSLSASVGRGQPQTEIKDGAVLRQGVQEHVSLFGETTELGKKKETPGANALEQGAELVEVDASEVVGVGEQRQPSDGEKRQLERGSISEERRLHKHSRQRPSEAGTPTCDGETSGEAHEERGGSTPQGRNENQQRSIESRGSHDIESHEAASSPRHQTWCQKCGKLITPLPVLLQGDSRRFAEIVGGVAAVFTSPPYAQDVIHARPSKMAVELHQGRQCLTGLGSYGNEKGQIADLPTGNLDAVLTSPPYAGSNQNYEAGEKYIDRSKGVHDRYSHQQDASYGAADGNIANLPTGSVDAVVTSPPYAESVHEGNGIDLAKIGRKGGPNSQSGAGGYGVTDGQIGSLVAGNLDGVVTSPPYGEVRQDGGGLNLEKIGDGSLASYTEGATDKWRTQRDQENLGNVSAETYWQAMAQVYTQCRLALRPGGIMAVVVKDYVKDKTRVPLCDQTLALLVSLGFTPVARIHAMLVKEQSHPQLIGPDVVTKRERKSFFRRLAEKKGSPRIDFEEVIVVRSQEGAP